MNVSQRFKFVRVGTVLFGAALLVFVAWTATSPGSARAAGTGPRLELNASGTGVTCDHPSQPSQCTVPVGAPFKVAVDFLEPPAGGYVAISTQVSFPGLTWTPASSREENVWPDNTLPVRSPDSAYHVHVVAHGGLTGTSPPFPVSHYAGPVVQFTLTCSAEPGSFEVALVTLDPNVSPLGASYTTPQDIITPVASKTVGQRNVDLENTGTTTTSVPVASLLNINCARVALATATSTSAPAAATATPGLPPTGSAGGTSDGGVAWPLIGGLMAAATLLATAGWQLRRRLRAS